MATMTVREFCALYRQHPRNVQQRLQQGLLPGVKEGRKWLVDDTVLQEAINRLDKQEAEQSKTVVYDKVILRPVEVAALLGIHRTNVSKFQTERRLGFIRVDGVRCCTINHLLAYLRKRYEFKRAKSSRAIRPEVLMLVREIIDRELTRPTLPDDIETVPTFDALEEMIEALKPFPEPERTYQLEGLWRTMMRDMKVTRRLSRRPQPLQPPTEQPPQS